MPELPEVEIIRLGLSAAMDGASFQAVTLNRRDLRFPFPEHFAKQLEGQRVRKLERRAKYILAPMESGLILAVHLGMTGRFTIQADGMASAATPGSFYYESGADPRHDHAIFVMSGGVTIRYNDVRRFGYMDLLRQEERETHPLFRDLGVEPLSPDLTPEALVTRAKGKAQPLKSFLLDQRIIAGLGNIYVCEALFRARLSPTAPAGFLGEGRKGRAGAERLCQAIKAVLSDAIEAGGSSLRDYRQANGAPGSFQDRFEVYGREGEPCVSGCGSVVTRLVQQGRSTFYCPKCQPV